MFCSAHGTQKRTQCYLRGQYPNIYIRSFMLSPRHVVSANARGAPKYVKDHREGCDMTMKDCLELDGDCRIVSLHMTFTDAVIKDIIKNILGPRPDQPEPGHVALAAPMRSGHSVGIEPGPRWPPSAYNGPQHGIRISSCFPVELCKKRQSQLLGMPLRHLLRQISREVNVFLQAKYSALEPRGVPNQLICGKLRFLQERLHWRLFITHPISERCLAVSWRPTLVVC